MTLASVMFPSSGGSSLFYVTGTGDGVATTASLPYADLTANIIEVTINGLMQYPTLDYTVSGTTLTFIPAVANGSIYTIRGQGNHTIDGVNLVDLVINTVDDVVGPSLADLFITGVANGTMTTVTLTSPDVTANTVLVTLNGVVQRPTDDYTVTGTTLSFTSAPANGYNYAIRGQGNYTIDGAGLDATISNVVATFDVTSSWFFS